MADLDLGIKSTKDKDALIDDLMKTLKIKGVGRDNLYTIEYRDSNPEKARKVVQSLTTIFIESSLGGKQSDADTAIKFVEEQIQVRRSLKAEARLKDFKLKEHRIEPQRQRARRCASSEIGSQLQRARLPSCARPKPAACHQAGNDG
ncbi:MAG: hypothetical protein IPI44_23710 [Sulfuritalea sp.]|nr:hypothetical protein [Sulfuritalea sp.]